MLENWHEDAFSFTSFLLAVIIKLSCMDRNRAANSEQGDTILDRTVPLRRSRHQTLLSLLREKASVGRSNSVCTWTIGLNLGSCRTLVNGSPPNASLLELELSSNLSDMKIHFFRQQQQQQPCIVPEASKNTRGYAHPHPHRRWSRGRIRLLRHVSKSRCQ